MSAENEKIKISNLNKLHFYKTILENHITQNLINITPEDIKKDFAEFFDNQEEKENFDKIIDSIKNDYITKLKKHIKKLYKEFHKKVKSLVVEDKVQKKNEIKIIKQEKFITLENEINEKVFNTNKIIEKQKEFENKLKNHFDEKLKSFLHQYK
jgi:hypothetical protein